MVYSKFKNFLDSKVAQTLTPILILEIFKDEDISSLAEGKEPSFCSNLSFSLWNLTTTSFFEMYIQVIFLDQNYIATSTKLNKFPQKRLWVLACSCT